MKQKKRVGYLIPACIGLLALTMLIPTNLLHADNGEHNQQMAESTKRGASYADQTGLYLAFNENGDVTYTNVDRDTYEVDPQGMNFKDHKPYARGTGGAASLNSVVNFNYRTQNDTNGYKEYYLNENKKGGTGYIAGQYAADAAYLGVSKDGKLIKFKMGGVVGWIDSSKVDVVPLKSAKSKNRYRVIDGKLYHDITLNIYANNYSSSVMVGYRQDYMKNNDVYYSYDGHYFYKDFTVMLSDYRAGNYKKAINATKPYYNYYQYLSHRAAAKFNAADYNYRVKAVIGSAKSKMQNLGSAFVKAQSDYSINSALVFGLACNESAWGQSSIALNKNNIFGHGAVDSDPFNQANSYANPTQSVLSHVKVWVGDGYIHPADWRFNGPHLGDKLSGMNVEYASDPYWGEKAAAQGYFLEMQTNKGDYNKYTIGVLNKDVSLMIRKEATSNSTAIYGTGNGDMVNDRPVKNYPFMITSEVKGQSVNGNTTWYKIMTDAVLNSSRTDLLYKKNGSIDTAYSTTRDYGYVSAYYVNKVNGANKVTAYKKGDPSHDGKISSMDYVLVKNHILNIKKLTGEAAKAADVNGDGKISSMDYVLIKNHILGISTIK